VNASFGTVFHSLRRDLLHEGTLGCTTAAIFGAARPSRIALDKPAPATSVNWMLELIGDPTLLERDQWSMIGTDGRAGADRYLSQASVLWGSGGHAFSVSHQSAAIFG